jgi:hypothetical protein
LALLACLVISSAIRSVLKRYDFNGVLLAIGALIFLTSRVLIMYETWPHSDAPNFAELSANVAAAMPALLAGTPATHPYDYAQGGQ